MQLHAIALYSHDGRRRHLRFRTGELNVISGMSGTGKTALLDIVDYCFGRTAPPLPTGPISDKVSWYSIIVGDRQAQLLVARPALTGQTSSRAMLRAATEIDFPEATELEANADSRAVRAALDRMLGLGGYEVTEYTGVRERLQASVSHAVLFCLQKQRELMSERHLFHRQDEPEVARDFEELFPYFIGAVDEQALAAQRRAAALRRQLRAIEQRMGRLERTATDLAQRDAALVVEARRMGLIPEIPGVEDVDDRQLLRTVREPTVSTEDAGDGTSAARQRELRRSLQEARSEIRMLREQRAALGELDSDRSAHESEVGIQAGRLGVIDHFEERRAHDSTTCVLCGSELSSPDETVKALTDAARQLDAQIAELRSAARDVTAAERAIDERIAELGRRIDALRAELDAAADVDEATRAAARETEQRAYLRGVIAEHLRVADLAGVDTRPALRAEARDLEQQVNRLTEGLDPASIRERVDERLEAAAVNMTAWARELDLEWADQGIVRIDRGRLTVAIQRPTGRTLLQQIGSGANHVGYHIVAHLALHHYFVQQRRPVPRFLFIDQPSLPFFPSAVADDAAVKDVDWQAVKRLFELMHRVVRELLGGFQVIVTDHALYREEPWFNRALVADWHTGEKLIPTDWPER